MINEIVVAVVVGLVMGLVQTIGMGYANKVEFRWLHESLTQIRTELTGFKEATAEELRRARDLMVEEAKRLEEMIKELDRRLSQLELKA